MDLFQCQKCYEFGKNLLRCSRCKVVHYCSKECQKLHWKIHKKDCHLPSELPQLGDEEQCWVDVFKTWRHQLKAYLPFIIYHIGRRDFPELPETQLFSMKIYTEMEVQVHRSHGKFNITNLCSRKMDTLKVIPGFYEKLQQLEQDHRNLHPNNELAFVLVHSNLLSIPAIMPIGRAASLTYLRTHFTLEQVLTTIESQLPSPFSNKQRQFLNQMLESKVQQSYQTLAAKNSFREFITNALLIYTSNPLHLTHCIWLDVTLGEELGKFQSFNSWETIPFENIGKRNPNIKVNKSFRKEIQAKIKAAQENGRPHVSMITIVFYDRTSTFSLFNPSMFDLDQSASTLSSDKAKAMAEERFQKCRQGAWLA